MKKTLLFVVLTLGSRSQGLGTEFLSNSKIQVCAEIEFWDEKSSVRRAEEVANVIFAPAGVKIEWHNAGSHQKHRTCGAAPEDSQIEVRLVTGAPASFHPDALAFSQLEAGAVIDVFFDRVVQMAGSNSKERVLGHVLVHEITHVIQGLNRHSQDGIMKARWSSRELLQMNYKPLPFTPEDIRLIHLGLARRSGVAVPAR